MRQETKQQVVTIRPPNFGIAEFIIRGTAPLVIHRFSAKTKLEMKNKMEEGKSASSKKNRTAKKTDDLYQEARYISTDGWDGLHAGSIRNALISACRLVNFKMTLGKLSLFVEPDGVDKLEPQIPLIRIYGKSEKLESIARVETGQPYVCVRSIFHKWECKVKIRFDADQFSLSDVTNLLSRVGAQVGLAEGRPDSKNSCGMGWGLFAIASKKELKV
jgi:hypothetical protein